MSEAQYRKERIERLLHELKYEITRGMMEGEIDEHMGFTFIVPVSKVYRKGVVHCEFRTLPVEHFGMSSGESSSIKLAVDNTCEKGQGSDAITETSNTESED